MAGTNTLALFLGVSGLKKKRLIAVFHQNCRFFRIEPVRIRVDSGHLLIRDLPVGAALRHLVDRLVGVAVDGVVVLGHGHLLSKFTAFVIIWEIKLECLKRSFGAVITYFLCEP